MQPQPAPGGMFAKDRFDIDLQADTVTCPAGTRTIRPAKAGGGAAASVRRAPGARWARSAPARRRAHRQRRASTSSSWPTPGPPSRPGLGRGLPGHPAEGGTQDRSPDAPSPRRTPCPGPRHNQGRRRLRFAGRSGQPGPPRRARTTSSRGPRMAGRTSVTGKTTAGQQIPHDNQITEPASGLRQPTRSQHHADTSRHSKHNRSAVTTYPRSPFDTDHLGELGRPLGHEGVDALPAVGGVGAFGDQAALDLHLLLQAVLQRGE